jgi:hypothetical protein
MKGIAMQMIDKGTTLEMWKSCDEQTEIAQFVSSTNAYELSQIRHDDLIQYALTCFKGASVHDYKFRSDDVISTELFKDEFSARYRLAAIVTTTKLN